MWGFLVNRFGCKPNQADAFVPLLSETLQNILRQEQTRLASFQADRATPARDADIALLACPPLALHKVRVRIPCYQRIPRWERFQIRKNAYNVGKFKDITTSLRKPNLWIRLFNHCPASCFELEAEIQAGEPRIKAIVYPVG